MTERADLTPKKRVVYRSPYFDGVLHEPGDVVMAVPKVYPDRYPEGHPEFPKPHPKAGQLDGDGFGPNLIPFDEALAMVGETREPGVVPEGVPAGSVLVNGVWYAPVVVQAEGPAAPAEADEPKTLDQLGKDAIIAALEARGIAIPPKATKAALIELAEANQVPLA